MSPYSIPMGPDRSDVSHAEHGLPADVPQASILLESCLLDKTSDLSNVFHLCFE